MQKIGQGAEAVLYKDNNQVIKERLSKGYRISQIDESLRAFRTRREAKVLQKLETLNFPAPRLQDFSDKRMSITMNFVPGDKLRDVLERGDDYQRFARDVGRKVGLMHRNNIIHGDLTTSNMIVQPEKREITFIDFGLSVFTEKVEDKAVDLFLMDRAFESKHYQLYPRIFEEVLEGYKEEYPDAEKILERFKQVQMRGRNKKSNLE